MNFLKSYIDKNFCSAYKPIPIPTTFEYSEKTVDEHGVRFWFDPKKLTHEWREECSAPYSIPYGEEYEELAKKFFPLSMFLDSDLCVDFELWYNELFKLPPTVGSCVATLKTIIVTIRTPEDYTLMQRVAQYVWDHDQEMTRIDRESYKRQRESILEEQRKKEAEEYEKKRLERELVQETIRIREEKEAEERRIEEEKENERMKKVNAAKQLAEQIEKMGRV